MIFSRLDRIYVYATIRELGEQVGIWNSIAHLSDHVPVFLRLRKTSAKLHRTVPFNRQLMHTTEWKNLLLAAWRAAINRDFNLPISERIALAVRMVKEASDTETKRKKINWEKEFEEQFEEVYAAELELQDHFNNQEIRDTLNKAQIALQQLQQARMEKKYKKQASRGSGSATDATNSFLTLMKGEGNRTS
jgi:hypothetical protein